MGWKEADRQAGGPALLDAAALKSQQFLVSLKSLHLPNLASQLWLLDSGSDVEERMGGESNQETGILMNRIRTMFATSRINTVTKHRYLLGEEEA